jgi:gliding motility-associated-like protein
MKSIGLVVVAIFLAFFAQAQLTLNGNQTATALAQTLAGPGVSVSGAFLKCDSNANAIFSTIPPASTNLGISDGIVLTSGSAYNWTDPFGNSLMGVGNSPTVVTTQNSDSTDADLALLITQSIRDACVLEFDFIPIGDTVKFDYVFGSCEYQNYTCSINDVFGFFITDPATGIKQNIAIVPGTTSCPVSVNSINCIGSPCVSATSSCFSGACSALTIATSCALFVCNPGPPTAPDTTIVYGGFTVPLTAIAAVTPCSTYHLKLAIADASDQVLDSGVFLKAGSLSSSAVSLTPISPFNFPLPYIAEGCSPGAILVTLPLPVVNDTVLHFTIGGTAINGVDYNFLPDSLIIPAGSSGGAFVISAINDATAEGPERVTIYRTFGCAASILDSATITIYDSLIMQVLNPDTTICLGDSIQIRGIADTLLNLSWAPANQVSNPNIINPYLIPTSSGTFVLTGTISNGTCPPVTQEVVVTLNPNPIVSTGPDVYLCKGMTYTFNAIATPVQSYSYSWTPSTFLSNASINNPVGTFTTEGTFTYVLRVDPAAAGCSGFDTVIVHVLPNDFTLLNNDTVSCEGFGVPTFVNGDPRFTYLWTPINYVANPTLPNTMISPMQTQTYTLTASYPGCPSMQHDFTIQVEPIPQVSVGPDRSMCQYDTIRIQSTVLPLSFNGYIYNWTPTTDLSNSNQSETVFSGSSSTVYTLNVSTPLANCTGTDIIALTVFPGDFANLLVTGSTVICPNDTVYLQANGAVQYLWQPSYWVSDSTSGNVAFYPVSDQIYTLYATSADGCFDTTTLQITIVEGAVLDAGPDVQLYPGDNYTFTPTTNCSQFLWTPSVYLSATNIIDPVVTNMIASTQYIVAGETEKGCKATDTVLVSMADQSKIAVPNSFSPGNGTSPNDFFSINRLGLASLNYFRIYNRWGELVYESSNIDGGWNGTYKGQPQPMGVYVYDIDAKNNKGQVFKKSGNVTLIR